MQKRKLGNTGFDISAVIYGGIVSMEDGQQASDRYVSWAIDQGVNYFDVAPPYGDAEEKLGNSLRPYRNDVFLACKTTNRLRKEAEEDLRNSMKLLHTDYFDVYQLHSLMDVEDVEKAFSKGGVMELMVKLKEDGFARKLGISAHSQEAAMKALSLYPFDTVVFPLNWGLGLKRGWGREVCGEAKEKGMGLIAIKAFIHRAWLDEAERYGSNFTKAWCKPIDIDDVALRLAAMKYALSLGVCALIPPGDFANFSFAVEHIDECIKNPLNDDDMEYLKGRLPEIEGHMFF